MDMTPAGPTWFSLSLNAISAMLAIALLLAAYRLLIGPTLANRVVALDMIALVLVQLFAVHAIETGEDAVLWPATIFAILVFMGTVGFARYVQQGGSDG